MTIHVFWLSRQWCGFVFRIVSFGVWFSDDVIQTLEIFLLSSNFSYVTFPYADYPPPERFQFVFVADITGNIILYLLFPELNIGFRQTIILTPLMSVPETTVDKYDSPVFGKNNVRLARQLSDLNTKPQTTREEILPDNHLWFGILSLYCRHAAAPLFGCHYVRHVRSD